MAEVEQRAFDARISLHTLCRQANVSGTIATRWLQKTGTPLLPTIGKLESQLALIEQERAP
jgi:hypothetical protein